MTINYENINQVIAALNQCVKENENKQTDTLNIRVSNLCADVACFLRKVQQDYEQWQKEQMTAKTIEGNVLANGMGEPILHLWDKGKHLVGKKVKVVVIEED